MTQLTGPLPTFSQPVLPVSRSSFRVTALGGGHGLSATLKALRIVAAEHLTAVCTVADDGGSSGRLRKDMDVLPPGDLRMALTALCDDTDWGRTWADVMQHRFRSKEGVSGTLDDHAMGNLLIVALWELLGDPVDGLRWAGALLGARGQVLPMSRTPLTLSGLVQPRGGEEPVRVTSQAELARAGNRGALSDVRLHPEEAEPSVEAVTAIELSDWVVLGPGSWYTSVLPHLLLPGLRSAVAETEAKRCIVMNLKLDTDETFGMSPADHLDVLARCAPGLRIDAVIADPRSVAESERESFQAAAARLGAEITYAKVRRESQPEVHDPLRLAIAFSEVFHG
ncbi:gluconeogenesis factor YvcK family protein [Nesterenkonia alkaliphila]|uniref:Putative gluconeogenesis factor n=1 Tax=Nesterenkonia alkaliphila TaxID=1463631 RepID=A0A7K1UMC3_9MICC|nr:uridine diphosphate-N-acetylglucosamine-binding protein YvcK [Nesterenkonia alkaliphila]MVT27613.1 uridine diphosphate-N-acetylglucosamine-binding protein YvcK [Nesterenkonia alkaliphila]GFZ79707.1 putative gluconeogenesis factor [Nesterenkonia alkaliphila]